jgi:hypothetical protein
VPEFDWEGTFNREFDKAVANDVAKSGFPTDTWLKLNASRVQTEPWWREEGPGFAKSFADWYESTPDAEVWITPDGRPALELELRVMFGPIPVVVYIDLILKLGSALVVTDYKTSAAEPDSLTQQGFYASAVELAYGKPWRPAYGTHFMARGIGPKDMDPDLKQRFMQPRPLDAYQYSIPYYTHQLELMDAGAEAGIFLANPGDHCRICGVAAACDAVGGVDAPKFRPRQH